MDERLNGRYKNTGSETIAVEKNQWKRVISTVNISSFYFKSLVPYHQA